MIREALVRARHVRFTIVRIVRRCAAVDRHRRLFAAYINQRYDTFTNHVVAHLSFLNLTMRGIDSECPRTNVLQ